MFFAHIPAGYLLSQGLLNIRAAQRLTPNTQRKLLATGLVASVLPDLDLVYFYLEACCRGGHRVLPSHWPMLWLGVALLVTLVAWIARRKDWLWYNLFLLANVQLHFLLDTVAGPIRWFHPFDPSYFTWIYVERKPGWWVWSYLTHISMIIELSIVVAACLYWWCARKAQARASAYQSI